MAKDKEDMWARMQTFAAKAGDLAPQCKNEAQTRLRLIEPYLELLGYNVREPDVCEPEFTADIGKVGEKVDYAIKHDGRPAILIEAKAASKNFSGQDSVPSQLQRYFMSEDAKFAVLTNGVVWNWYMSDDGRKLEETPFKVHDVCHPERTDMDWLWSVSGYVSDSERATKQAEAERMRSAFWEWIRKIHRSPSDGFIKFLLKDLKKGGLNFGFATQARVKESREHFRNTFEDYIDGETNRLLNAARERLDEDDKPNNTNGPEDDLLPSEPDGIAWRVQGEDWQLEKNGRTLQLSVARWLASVDKRGADNFYRNAVDGSGKRLFVESVPESEKRRYRKVEEGLGYWTRIHMSNRSRLSRLKRWCNQTQKTEGGPVIWDEDIEVRLPIRGKE